mgnify:CR=1 FL=1
MQAFIVPAEADKFKAAVTEASNAYNKVSCEMAKSPPREMKETEMPDSSRKGNKRTSGSLNKAKEKQESIGDETHREMGKPITRKRRREGQELQAEKHITSGEDSVEASTETQAQFSYKRRKLLTAHRGLGEKKDKTNNRGTYDQKTKGDDGVSFDNSCS